MRQHDKLASHVQQLADELSALYVTFEGAVLVHGDDYWRAQFGDIPEKLRRLHARLSVLREFRRRGRGRLLAQQERLYLLGYVIATTGEPRYEEVSVLVYEREGANLQVEALGAFRARHASVINTLVESLRRETASDTAAGLAPPPDRPVTLNNPTPTRDDD